MKKNIRDAVWYIIVAGSDCYNIIFLFGNINKNVVMCWVIFLKYAPTYLDQLFYTK